MSKSKQRYLITYDAESDEPTKVEWLGGAGELRRIPLDAVTFRVRGDVVHGQAVPAERRTVSSPDRAPRPDAIPIGATPRTRIGETRA